MLPHQNNYGLLLLGLEANFVNKIFEQHPPHKSVCSNRSNDEHSFRNNCPEKWFPYAHDRLKDSIKMCDIIQSNRSRCATIVVHWRCPKYNTGKIPTAWQNANFSTDSYYKVIYIKSTNLKRKIFWAKFFLHSSGLLQMNVVFCWTWCLWFS